MRMTWMLLGLALQLSILVLFYRLFFEERTFIVHRASSETFPTLQDVQIPDDSQINWKSLHETTNLATEIKWKEIPRKPAPSAEEMNDKWIVVTTINSPTEDVKKLAAIEGWKVVVVGDTKTPTDWR